MLLNLPQTYLIGLCLLLLVIAILVGRQLLKVRKDEAQLIKLEKLDSLVSKASLHARYDEWNSVKGVIQTMEDVLGRWDPRDWRHTYRKE